MLLDKVEIPEAAKGPWRIERFKTDRTDFHSMLRGRGVPEGEEFTRLMRGNVLVMSDTPAEMRDHYYAVHKAKGSCLINGLGIGMVLKGNYIDDSLGLVIPYWGFEPITNRICAASAENGPPFNIPPNSSHFPGHSWTGLVVPSIAICRSAAAAMAFGFASGSIRSSSPCMGPIPLHTHSLTDQFPPSFKSVVNTAASGRISEESPAKNICSVIPLWRPAALRIAACCTGENARGAFAACIAADVCIAALAAATASVRALATSFLALVNCAIVAVSCACCAAANFWKSESCPLISFSFCATKDGNVSTLTPRRAASWAACCAILWSSSWSFPSWAIFSSESCCNLTAAIEARPPKIYSPPQPMATRILPIINNRFSPFGMSLLYISNARNSITNPTTTAIVARSSQLLAASYAAFNTALDASSIGYSIYLAHNRRKTIFSLGCLFMAAMGAVYLVIRKILGCNK